MRVAGRVRAQRLLMLVVVTAVLAASVAMTLRRPGTSASADQPKGDPRIAGTPVTVGQSPCGSGWSGGKAGRLTFALWNSSSVVAEIQIQNVDNRKIYADVEDLGVGATRTLSVSLAAGDYRFLCLAADGQPMASDPWTLTGDYSSPLTPGVLPTTDLDLVGPNEAYSAWVARQLASLRTPLANLVRFARAGKLQPARRAWANAHHGYLLLGAAYGAFGDLGDSIDPHPAYGVAPLTDPDLTGFAKIEAQLWHVQPVPAPHKRTRKARAATRRARRRVATYVKQHVTPVATQLAADVATLAKTFNNPVTPTNNELGLRAHEILEDALRFELTGQDDAGSHMTLSNIDAMVDATRDIMSPLRGLLRARDADLAVTDAWLSRLKTYVDSFHNVRTGAWTPLQSLSVQQRRRLNAITSQTLEYLSEIAVVLDPVQKGPQ